MLSSISGSSIYGSMVKVSIEKLRAFWIFFEK